MKKLMPVILIALAILALGAWIYNGRYSPRATAAMAADQFWTAVVAGDEAAVAAMLGTEADFSPAQIVADHQGYGYHPGRPHVIDALKPNQTGAEFLVNVSVYHMPDGWPSGRTVALKRVDGRWVAVRAGSGFSF